MKKVEEAIKYALETLKSNPDDLFDLFSTSRDYEGDDYKRWLAKKIIDLAEKEGVAIKRVVMVLLLKLVIPLFPRRVWADHLVGPFPRKIQEREMIYRLYLCAELHTITNSCEKC